MNNSLKSKLNSPNSNTGESWRIAEVMQETGLSKELIHHYLRQQLVPRSGSRARYNEQQVRLLRQIRVLREDHNLPLELIRRIFNILEFAPERIEALTTSESLGKRLTRFVDGELLSTERLTAADLARSVGIGQERLAEYLRAKVITPYEQDGQTLFTHYGAKVVALCERGIGLGIPFESFRTIGSYIRVAFELEQAGFYAVPPPEGDGQQFLAELFLRHELAGSFVENVLAALADLRIREGLGQALPQRLKLDDIVYQPSPAFVQHHGIQDHIDSAQSGCAESDKRELWLRTGELLMHAGRYHEAVFVLEEGLGRWPQATSLRGALGRALLLAGETERGAEQLGRAAAEVSEEPRTTVFDALAQFKRALATGRPEALVRQGGAIAGRVDQALEQAIDAPDAKRLEATIFGGWLLTALPPVFERYERGCQLLSASIAEIANASDLAQDLPGLRQRLWINSAFLLFTALTRNNGSPKTPPSNTAPLPSLEQLRTLICRLDPACAFARQVFLQHDYDEEMK